MSVDRRENHEPKAPFAQRRADSKPDMTTAPQGPRFGFDDLDHPERSLEALAHWDELEPDLLKALESDPQHGPRLETLRAAERWLLDGGLRSDAISSRTLASSRLQPLLAPCPSSEDLYDFGRGPGYAQLDARRRAEIEAHVQACDECQGLVTTLSAPPPVPLDFDPLDVERSPERPAPERIAAIPSVHVHPARQAVPGGLPGLLSHREAPRLEEIAGETAAPLRSLADERARRTARPWMRFAAAASVLLVAGAALVAYVERDTGRGPLAGPLLRGRSLENLVAPRGRVLAASAGLAEQFPALARGTSFELAPTPNAENYRVELLRAGADPFTRGERLGEAAGSTPLVTLDGTLAPGRYTWDAWSTVNGIEQHLGTRDFEVVDAPSVAEGLAALGAVQDEGERTLRALELLDRAGFAADARALARTLPAGELRERWLAPVPAR